MAKPIPEECQLCRLLDYRGDEINEPEGSVTVAREDGGDKFVYCCRRCSEEMFDHDPGFTPLEDTEEP